MPAPSYITQSDPYSVPSYLNQTTTPGGGTGFTHNQFPNSLYVRDAGGFKLLDKPIPGPTVGGSPNIANASPAPASRPAPANLPGGSLPPQDPNLRISGKDFYGHYTVYGSGNPGGAVYAEGDPNLLAARQAIAQRDQNTAKPTASSQGSPMPGIEDFIVRPNGEIIDRKTGQPLKLEDRGFNRGPQPITYNGKQYMQAGTQNAQGQWEIPANINPGHAPPTWINGKPYYEYTPPPPPGLYNASNGQTPPGGPQQPQGVPQPQNPLNAVPGESYAQYEARQGFPQGNQPQPEANPAQFAQSGQDFNAYEAGQGFPQTGTQTPQGGQGGGQGERGGTPQVQGAETVADPLKPLKDLLQTYGITPDSAKATSNPLGTFDDVYQKVYTQLGLGDVKTHIEALTEKLSKIDERIVDKQISINSNPWLSEGLRVKQLNALTKATQQERANVLNELKLNEAEFDRGRHDARYAAHEMISQFNQNRNFDAKELEYRINLAEKSLEAKQKSQERADTAAATESRFERSQKATESRFNRLHGSSSIEPHFSNSQLNKGAATARVPFADFNKLDNDTKNFFINNGDQIKNKYKIIDKAFKSGEDPRKIEAEITSSGAPNSVKDSLVRYLWSVFPRQQPSHKFLGIF